MLVVKVHMVPQDGGSGGGGVTAAAPGALLSALPPLQHPHPQQQQRDALDVYCGAGAQLVRWLAHAACARLAHKRGEPLGAHVPLAVLGRGGRALDPDLVLSEAVAGFADGGGGGSGGSGSGGANTGGGGGGGGRSQQQQHGGGAAGGGGSKAATAAVLAVGEGVQRGAAQQQQQQTQQQQQQQQQNSSSSQPVPELTVVYGAGPAAFAARWDGRPRTPPFEWDARARRERAPPHDAWLAALDPDAEGLAALQDPELLAAAPRGAGAADLQRAKAVLCEHAGALQALLLVAAADAAAPPEALGRVTLAQLKALLSSARVVAGSGSGKGGAGGAAGGGTAGGSGAAAAAGAPPDTADRAYAAALATPRALARKAEDGGAPPGLDLPDFMVALAHVAHARYAAGSFAPPPPTALPGPAGNASDAGAAGTAAALPPPLATTAAAAAHGAAAAAPLATKLLSLVHDGLVPTVFADLARRVERIAAAAAAPNAALLMRKARSLTERALDRCQLRRVKAHTLRVDLRHVCVALQRWGVLGRELSLPDLVPAILFALQQASDPLRFALLPQPPAVDHAAFERLLLGAAHVQWRARRRTGTAGGGDGSGGFEPALAEFLEGVFRRAGVLAEPSPAPSSAAGAAAAAAASTGAA